MLATAAPSGVTANGVPKNLVREAATIVPNFWHGICGGGMRVLCKWRAKVLAWNLQ